MSQRRDSPPLVLIFTVTVTGITVNTLVAPAIPEILDDLQTSRSLAGLLIAAGTFPGIFLAPIIGVLADRYGRREVLLPCLAVFGLAGGLGGLAPTFPVLVGLRLLQGAGSAGLINLAVVLVGDHWAGTERARNLGRNSAVLTVSLAVLPTVGGALTDLAGWRAAFAPFPLALLTAAYLARRLPPAEGVQPVGVRSQVAAALPILRSRSVLAALVTGTTFFVLIFGLLLTVMPLHLEETFGLGAGTRGLILGLPAVSSTVASLLLGRMTARVGRRAVVLSSLVLVTVALAGIAALPHLVALLVAVLVFGYGEGLLLPSIQDIATGAAPTESRGTVVATLVGAFRFGQTIGPLLAGALLAAAGVPATFAAGAALAGAVLAALLVGVRRSSPDRPLLAADRTR